MDVSDMLDVLHYFFDEDSRYSTPEEASHQDAVRHHVYGTLYQESYKYAVSPDSEPASRDFTPDIGEDDDFDVTPFNTKKKEVKPFVPSTDFDPDSFNPFGDVLDGPIG
jgi:hypothetical protein